MNGANLIMKSLLLYEKSYNIFIKNFYVILVMPKNNYVVSRIYYTIQKIIKRYSKDKW